MTWSIVVIVTIVKIQRKKVEAKDDLCAVIETVIALNEKFKADHVINVMRGKTSAEVRSYGHEDLDVFGIASSSDERFLNAVIRQAIIADTLTRTLKAMES